MDIREDDPISLKDKELSIGDSNQEHLKTYKSLDILQKRKMSKHNEFVTLRGSSKEWNSKLGPTY